LLVESTANYKLLRAYTSKLVALSYRFATISVVGQNGADHMVHEYTHKAQSDVLMAVGLPDGRLPSTAPVEGCFLMSASQAQFIKQSGHGVEAYCLGHNTWTRPNLFVKALKLPTFRPIFATEKMLFTDQLHSHSKVVPGRHGTNPGEIVQRRRDMLKQLDPYGMPKLQVTPVDLKHYMSLDDVLDFKEALSILEKIIEKHCLEAHIEMVPFGLGNFLSQFMTEHPGSAKVFVHSPFKAYASPQEHVSRLPVESPCKEFLQAVTSPKSRKKKDRKSWSNECEKIDELEEIQDRLAVFLTVSEKKGHERGKEEICSSDVTFVPCLSTYLDINAFLALLHGSELQTWVRSARYRWNKICKMRGLFSALAEENHVNKRSAFSAVLSSGRTLKMIVLSWRKLTPKSRPGKLPTKVQQRKSFKNVQTESIISESMRNANSSQSDLPDMVGATLSSEHSEAAEGRLVSEALVDIGAAATEILQASRPAELFYESRVASAERLVAWFVLLHAMAEPSSRLPFLSYELGKSESRLRVASTPAPVPFSGLESGQTDTIDSSESEVSILETECFV